jgi:hypothetical protein
MDNVCVCDDLECTSSCKECCDQGTIETDPCDDANLLNPNGFPGASYRWPCRCEKGKGKKVVVR